MKLINYLLFCVILFCHFLVFRATVSAESYWQKFVTFFNKLKKQNITKELVTKI